MTDEVRGRLIEVAGRTTQDLGLGRIVGQVLAYVYLATDRCSLDDLGRDLGLSKAAVSIAARQLDSLGLVKRVWEKGDRKNYYAVVDHFGTALRRGLTGLVGGKVRSIGAELDRIESILTDGKDPVNENLILLKKRVKLVRKYQQLANDVLDSPLLKLLGK